MTTREPTPDLPGDGERTNDRERERELASLRAEIVALRAALAARPKRNSPERVAAIAATVRSRWGRFRAPVRTDAPPALSYSPLPSRPWEWALVVAILAVAAVLRFDDLTTSPPGLHGDEAVAGLDARRILDEGWIGPYSPSALGQPTGPLYLTALSLRLFGDDTILAVRFVPALVGTLTVALWYVVLRRNLGPAVALVGAALLATLGWHIHYARVGFPLESWPLVVALATAALGEALRTGRTVWWVAAGGLGGLGIYAYNAHPLFLAALGLFVLWHAYGWRPVAALAALVGYALRPEPPWLAALAIAVLGLLTTPRLRDPERFVHLSAFAAALGVVALPMVAFAADPANGYFAHHRLTSILNKEDWITLSGVDDQLRFLGRRYLGFWDRLAFSPKLDGGDATGVAPVVPWPTLALAGGGVLLGLLRRRPQPVVVLGVLVVAVMPLAAVLSVDGTARRTFAMTPFLAMLAAVAVVRLVELARKRGAVRAGVAATVMALLVAWSVYENLSDELGTVRGSYEEAWVFAEEITEAAKFMDRLPPDSYVYFYSDRWSVDYETRRYLAPDVAAEDRSAEFGEFGFVVAPGVQRPVFVLLNAYREQLDAIRGRYPGGETVLGPPLLGQPTFIAYSPPANVVPPLTAPVPPGG